MKCINYWLTVFLVIMLMAGCAVTGGTGPTGSIHVALKNTDKISKHKTILVETSTVLPQAKNEIVEFQGMLISKLQETGKFEQIISNTNAQGAAPDLRIHTKIVELQVAQDQGGALVARAILGKFAGRFGVVVEVELIEVMTGKAIGKARVEGKSGTVTNVTTTEALREAVHLVTDFVQSNM